MAKKRRVGRYPKAFRQMAVARMKSCENIVGLSKELGVNRVLLYKWRDHLEPVDDGEEPPENSREPKLRKEIGQLKRLLADKTLEVDFSKVPCKKSRLDARAAATLAEGIYDQIREVMPMQGSLSIERMCQLARVSRAGFYRSLKEQMPVEEEMEVRSAIQQIALEHRRRYGYRRVTAELRRRGMLVNHKRVARMMREDNLLAIQPRAFVVTTDSDHELEVYLNLASRMKLTGINQLWVADITYIRLRASSFIWP